LYRRPVACLFLIVVGAVAVACGLDAVGALEAEAPSPDASVDDPGTVPVVDASPDAADASFDADADATSDAEAGPRCDGGRYTDPLTTLDASPWLVLHDTSNGAYPQVDPSAEGPAVSFVLPGAASSLGSIWLQPPIAFKAFDVSFRYLMTCPDAGGCSDGLAVAWLEATDAGAAALQTYTSTATFGLPPGARGGAVAFDVHQDLATGDGVTPAISFLGLDGGVAGAYDWHTKTASTAVLAGNHAVAIRVRQGMAEVKLDGVVKLTGPVSTDFTGWFGFAASSGAELGTFAVRSFDATFYECDNP
jgi:hypothetical protein